MKNKKKGLALFIMMIMLLLSLVGCGKNLNNMLVQEENKTQMETVDTIDESENIEETETVLDETMENISEKNDMNIEEKEKFEQTNVQEIEEKDETQEIQYIEVDEIVYATSTVNIRSKATTDSEIIDKLYKNKSIQRIGVTEEWSKVLYEGNECFVATEYLTLEEPVAGGHLIAIDAGHQEKGNSEHEPIGPGSSTTKPKVASGTTGIATGVPEYKLTLDVSIKLRDELVARGYEVLMIRESHEVDISNAQRAQIANDAGVEAFIRIHANGSENTSVNGILTMCQTDSNPYNASLYSQSRSLSEKVLSEMISATGANNRGIIETDTMSGINWCQTPVTIVEMGFMSNPDEDQLMQDSEYQDKLVQGMANGIDDYFAN